MVICATVYHLNFEGLIFFKFHELWVIHEIISTLKVSCCEHVTGMMARWLYFKSEDGQ